MTSTLLTERYADQIAGVLSCYDRIVVRGTLPKICHARGMTSYLYEHKVRIFDFPRFAQPFRDQLRDNAERWASEQGLKIEHLAKKSFRKEDRIKQVLKERGEHPGAVWIFSAVETCVTYQPWYNKVTHQSYLVPRRNKCLHYYFYFIDEELGLCHVRVPTWLPCRLHIGFNGHNWLAAQLRRQKIQHALLDNAFVEIQDWKRAQQIADGWRAQQLHSKLDELAQRFCPILGQFGVRYHWSIEQCEYATDVVFRRQADLQPWYEHLVRTAVHTVKADNIATFLSRKLTGKYQGEMGNRFNVRIQGTRIRHSMGPASLKMYDKFGLILRLETTVNDVSFFKHYREVEHLDGTKETKYTKMQKSIYSLPALRELLVAANRRYLEFLSAMDDPSAGMGRLDRVSQTVWEKDRSYPGFNFFSSSDQTLLEVIARGEYNISGLQNKLLRSQLPGKSSAQISRLLKRLRLHGFIRKIGRSYKYYLTPLGKQVIMAGLKLKEFFLVPRLAYSS